METLYCTSALVMVLLSMIVKSTSGQAGTLGFFLNGVAYPNGSTVLRTDIGEVDAALQCTTDSTTCCRNSIGGEIRAGEFYFPLANGGGPVQPPITITDGYYRNRMSQFIRLHRQPTGVITGEFRCSIPDANRMNVNLFITIVDIAVSITTSGTKIAGVTYSLVCFVTVTGSIEQPSITWLDPMNSQVPSEMVSSTGDMSTLTFNPLSASHAGTYTCRATLDGATGTATEDIVQVPQPTVYLISSSTNPVVSGSLVTLTCTVEFHQPVDAPVTSLSVVWTGPVGLAITGATYPAVMKSFTLYQSSVTTKLNFSGKYTCTANVSGAIEVSASTSIEIVGGMFQLRLRGTDICSQWYHENSNKSHQYSKFIKEAVTEAVTRRCKCQFLVSNLLEDSFSCEESTNFLTYRSTLCGTYNFNCTKITNLIQDWVSSGPRIKIGYDREYVRIDSNCPVAISSLDEPDCGHNNNGNNIGCQTYGDNPESFTNCAQELENNQIARCIEGCVVRNG